MPKPLAICIEDLEPDEGPRYVRCVAVVGRQPGLRIGRGAAILWRSDEDVACELWVSGDDQMILFRPEGARALRLVRGGRGLDVPVGKPVVMLDQDVFEVGSKRFRLHIHGEANQVAPPSALPEPRFSQAARLATVVALGAAVVACNRPVEVRESPPVVPVEDAGAPPPPTAPPATSPAPEPTIPPSTEPPPTATPVQSAPIEVREAPPEMPDPD